MAESLTGMSLLEQLDLHRNMIGSEGAQAGEEFRSPGQAGAEDSRAYRIVTTTAHLGVRPFARESNFDARPWRPLSRAWPR